MRPDVHRERSHPRDARWCGSYRHPSSSGAQAGRRGRRRAGPRGRVRRVRSRPSHDPSSVDRHGRASPTVHCWRSGDPQTRSGSRTHCDHRSPDGRRCDAAPRRARPSSPASRPDHGPRRAAALRCDSRCSRRGRSVRRAPLVRRPGSDRRRSRCRANLRYRYDPSHRGTRPRCRPIGRHRCDRRPNRCDPNRTRSRARHRRGPTRIARRSPSGRRRARSRRNGRSCWDAGAR